LTTYHVTGVFLLEDPASATTEIFTSAIAGPVGIDAAVVVTDSTVESAILDNLDRLMSESGVSYHHIVRDTARPLSAQLSELVASYQLRPDTQSWLWFLTDDTFVCESSLARQLQAVEISPSVAVAGAKQLANRQLINVGLSVAHSGEIVSLIEPGELDQGQYDHRTDVFAVSLPGMLIQSELFDQLGGFDPYTPEVAQTVDLCWRARLAGHRVAVVPAAEVQHQAVPEEPPIADTWEASRWLRLKHTGVFGAIGGWLWGFLAALGVMLTGLFVKDPGTGTAQATGILRTLGRPMQLVSSRRAARKTRTRPFDAVDELRPSRARVLDYRRSLFEGGDTDRVIGDGRGVSDTPQEATGGHDDFDQLATPERNWVDIGAVTLTIVLGIVALLGLRHLLGVPALAGGNLLPASQDLAVLIAKAASGWAHAGAGAPGYDGPFGWLMVLFGLTTNASAVLVWLWVLALPLAGLGAWTLAGTLTTSRFVRVAAGLVWAGAPMFLIALSEGRLGGLLVHLLLPWFLLAILRAVGYDPAATRLETIRAGDDERPILLGRKPRNVKSTTSLTAAAWIAILLTAITAAAPSMFVPLTAGIIILALVLRSRAKVLWWTPILALTALLPAIIAHGTDLRAILADPGAPVGFEPAPAWKFLFGLPHDVAFDAGLAELPWLDAFSPAAPWTGIAIGLIAVPILVLAGIGALSPRAGGGLARFGLLAVFLGLAVAVFNSSLIFAIDQTGAPVALSTIPPVSLVWLGLLTAAVIGVNVLARTWPRTATGSAAVPRLQAGWPANTVTSLLLITGVVSVGLWLTPRVVPTETLTEARETAIDQRGVATAEAATDQQVDENSTRAGLAFVTGAPTVTGVEQHALPATAVDSATSELQTRTLVITRTSEGIRTHLISGEGTMIDDMTGTWTSRTVAGELFDPQPAPADDADDALRTVAAQLTTGTDADPRPILNALGAGYVVLTDPSGTETTLAAGIDAAPGMASVGHTQAGWLWRVVPDDTSDEAADDDGPQLGVEVLNEDGTGQPRGIATARARVVEDETTVALAASKPDGSIEVRLPEATTERELILAERANPGFRAWLDGEELESTVTDPEWVQAFALPASGGTLTVEFAPAAGTWLWLIPGILGILTLLLGIPAPVRTSSRRVDDQ
jgi:hypothetical protein